MRIALTCAHAGTHTHPHPCAHTNLAPPGKGKLMVDVGFWKWALAPYKPSASSVLLISKRAGCHTHRKRQRDGKNRAGLEYLLLHGKLAEGKARVFRAAALPWQDGLRTGD